MDESTDAVITVEVGISPPLGHLRPVSLNMVGCEDGGADVGSPGNVVYRDHQLQPLDGDQHGGESNLPHVVDGVIPHGFSQGQGVLGSSSSKGNIQGHGSSVPHMKIVGINQQLGQARTMVRLFEQQENKNHD